MGSVLEHGILDSFLNHLQCLLGGFGTFAKSQFTSAHIHIRYERRLHVACRVLSRLLRHASFIGAAECMQRIDLATMSSSSLLSLLQFDPSLVTK
jgi:hypothetical protein